MGRGRNRASIELYEAQAQARDKALPGRKKCPLWHGGGKSASLEKAHWEWAKGIAPVDCVNKGEGGCSHVWEDPKRPPSSVNGRAATSSQRRRLPIDVPRRGEEVVEPASVQAAILLPGSPPRLPELAASQIPLAGAADSDEGSDVSSYGSNKSVDVEGSDRIFDMEFDETNANQPGPVAGASAPSMSHLVARLAVAHPNSSDVSSLDIGPSMASNDDDSQKRGRQPRLNRRNSAAKVLPTSCPVTRTAISTTTRQHDPCTRDQQADATGNDKENEQYDYRNFSSSSEEDEEEILFMKGPKKSG